MQEQKIWHAGVLGMTLNVDEGRITIFRSTLETLGWPSHYRFLYNPQMNQIAVQVCSAADAGAHRVGKLNEFSSCEIKCVAFVRMVYKNAKWDKRRSYRMIGNPFPEQRLVSFQIQEALPIENGRVLDGTGSPTFALCRAVCSRAAPCCFQIQPRRTALSRAGKPQDVIGLESLHRASGRDKLPPRF